MGLTCKPVGKMKSITRKLENQLSEEAKLQKEKKGKKADKRQVVMAVWITGDIHGNPQRFSTDNFPEQKEMTKDDVVIILGDFGLVWDYSGENKTEKYWLDWLENKPFTTLFVDGNHDNFDRLDDYPIEKWHGGNVHFIRPSVIHLMRSQIFNIEDKLFFTFGGASSHDISAGILELDDPDFKEKKKRLDKNPYALYRINHISW